MVEPEAGHQHLHHHGVDWPRTWQGRLGLLGVAVVALFLNATGLLTRAFGVDTALLVAVVGGYPLVMRAVYAIRSRQITYDITIAVAATIAAAAGQYLAAAEVVLIVLVGDALEHWAMHRADRAIAGLLSVQPDHASVIRDGREQRVAATDVRLTDRVVVRGGERIPVDGAVVGGQATIDQSLVTGESVPVLKETGAQVFCGSILEHGALEIQPELVGQNTTLARIGRLVGDAKRRRPPLVRTADRLSRIFLPAIIVSAVVVYLVTGEALRSVAVMLVACSCALVYAAPAAFAAALARLARDGMLVKGGDTLEALSTVTAVAFDKTGTLTNGRPGVTGATGTNAFSSDDVLQFAASAEHHSEHAFGRAIVAEAGRRHLPLLETGEFRSRPGLGIVGTVTGREVWVGSVAFIRELAPNLVGEVERLIAKSGRAADTHVLVAVDGTLIGLVTLQDVPRASAVAAIAGLRAAGITQITLLTGDDRGVAEAVAAQVGIDVSAVHANLLPEEKLRKLREMSEAGAKVLMAGDGVNDAPSLAAAHVGVAFGRGAADLSAEAAQVVILEPRLEAIPELIVFARKTVRRVRFNIVAFALVVNTAAILAAGFGYLKPAASAILHQLVSLVVILGSVSLLVEDRIANAGAWRDWGRSLVQGVASWRDTAFDAARRVAERHGRVLVRATLASAAIIWALSGVTMLGPEETAVVQRFGRLVEAQLPPGLHMRAPWPIEVVTRLTPRRVRVLEEGFRTPPGMVPVPVDYEWNTSHGAGQVQQVMDENLVLTGDENMSELYAVVQYAIADPARYFFGVRDGEALVRMMAEGTLRNLVASFPLDTLLTTDRQVLQDKWVEALRARLKAVDVGVEILGIHLADVHPPVEVVASFRDVASAEEDKLMQVNEAEAYSKESIPIARGNAKAKLEEAAGYRASRMSRADGDAARFLARMTPVGSSQLTLFRLQMEAIDAVLPGKRILITDDKGGRRSIVFIGGDADLLKVLGTSAIGTPPPGAPRSGPPGAEEDDR